MARAKPARLTGVPGPLVVVAAALIRDSKVLAAQRSYPPELDGKWELPGGKVAPGETEGTALERECREELGISVQVHERVGPDLPTTGVSAVLRVYRCTLVGGEPIPHEHHALRWITAGELVDLDWLKTDRPLVSHLQELLA